MSVDNLSECSFCFESFKFSSSVDKYFHFLRHYSEHNLRPDRCSQSVSSRENIRNVEVVARLKALVNHYKSLSQEDPKFQVLYLMMKLSQVMCQVPPGSTAWLDETELARRQAMASARVRDRIKMEH